MAKVSVFNLEGQQVGEVELNDSIFGVEVKQHLVWEAVKQQLASRRQGTHSTLRRSEVRGGGKKPYRQKGTGRARQGSTRAPNFVGGGKVFTPKPRDYSYLLPKKARRSALCSVLTMRAQNNGLLVLDGAELAQIKTKRMAEVFQRFNLSSVLVVDRLDNTKLFKSVRNIAKTSFLPPEGVNVYDVLRHTTLLISMAGLKDIESRLAHRSAGQDRGAEEGAGS